MEIKVPKTLKVLTSAHVAAIKYSHEEIVIPDGIQEISDYTFSGYWTKKVVLPKTLKKVGSHAFDKCTYLEDVIFSNGIEEIGEFAFSNCYNLKYVFLPSTLKKIGDYAFDTSYTQFEKTATGRYKVKNGNRTL